MSVAFVAFANADLEVANAILDLLKRAGAAPRAFQDFLPGRDFSRMYGELESAEAIIVVWPAAQIEPQSDLSRAIELGEFKDNLILVARRGTQFDRTLLREILYADDHRFEEKFTQAYQATAYRHWRRPRADGRSAAKQLSTSALFDPEPPTKYRDRRNPETYVQVDTTLLETASEPDLADRATEMRILTDRWRTIGDYGLSSRSRVRHFHDYIDLYGEVSPLVIVAVPAYTNELALLHHLAHMETAPLLSGRFLIIPIEGAGQTLEKPRRFRHWMLNSNTYRDRINSSPISGIRLEILLDFATRKFARFIDEWHHNLRNQKVETEVDAALLLNNRTDEHPFYFVSYSRNDGPQIRQVVGELDQLGLRTWFDTNSIVGGEVFLRSLRKGIDDSAGVLPFCSENFSTSDWCLREMLFAINRTKKINPVWLRNPALQDEMLLLLGIYQAVNVEGREPSAAARSIYESISARSEST